MSFQSFFDAYLECALWSSSAVIDGEDVQLDARDGGIAPEALAHLRSEAMAFYAENSELFDDDDDLAGHDFWLTRNGHGAGFWDGDWPHDVGLQLTAASEAWGTCDLYIGDDGQIYVA